MTTTHEREQADTAMTGIYVAVIVVEAFIIAALWVLGRIYA